MGKKIEYVDLGDNFVVEKEKYDKAHKIWLKMPKGDKLKAIDIIKNHIDEVFIEEAKMEMQKEEKFKLKIKEETYKKIDKKFNI